MKAVFLKVKYLAYRVKHFLFVFSRLLDPNLLGLRPLRVCNLFVFFSCAFWLSRGLLDFSTRLFDVGCFGSRLSFPKQFAVRESDSPIAKP